MWEDQFTSWELSPSPNLDPSPNLTTCRSEPVDLLDQTRNLLTLHSEPTRCMHVALPDRFSGRKKDFWQFRWQFGLYITVNWLDFLDDKSQILFMLSYMGEGQAELWSSAYVDGALQHNDWGTWNGFTTILSRDFRDKEELHWALEYFLKLEQLASTASVNVDDSSHILLQVEQNFNLVLIDQLYQSPDAPRTYSDYKWQIMAMDEMRHRWEAFRKNPTHPRITRPNPKQNTEAMEVDKMKSVDSRKCFKCGKPGHLIRNCPDSEGNWAIEEKDF
jgi:hypothetical protein